MPFLLIFPVYAPLFLASLILGIIAIAQNRTGHGIALLLASLLTPPLIAFVVLTTVLGALLTAGTRPTSTPFGVSCLPATAKPSATPVTAGVKQIPTSPISLDLLLHRIDAYGKQYAEATTSVRKDRIRQNAQQWAREALKDRKMTVRAIVANVRMQEEGAVSITFKDLNLGTYASRKDSSINVRVPGAVRLKMSREQALKVSPGLTIEMTGQPEFAPAGNLLLAALGDSGALLSISFKADIRLLGSLRLQDMKTCIMR